MSEYYGKYKEADLITRQKTATKNTIDVCKILKTAIIDPGLTNLASYLPQGLSSVLPGVDQQYIDRLASQGQSTILNAKNAIPISYIIDNALEAFTKSPGAPGQAPVGQAATGKTTYNPKTLAKE